MSSEISNTQNILIDPDGRIQFVWDDDLAGMIDLGKPSIRRASFVRPTDEGRWEVDLWPVDGPKLGPYRFRNQALAVERRWLRTHRGL